jgi:CRP/FNR family transcriptional regulator, polysaccharide utilization system transcription regulator
MEEGSCFKDLLVDEQEFLQHRKKQISYFSGENIFKQGAFAPYVMLILKGLVKVYLQTGYGKQINLRIAKAGEFLAFSSVFGEEVYTYSSLAITDAEICMIDKDGLSELLKNNPDFAMEVTSRNYKIEKQLIEIIGNLSHKQMRGKLAAALLYLTGKDFEQDKIFQYLTRQDIAEFAAISTESTIRFLKEFEKENLIKLNGKEVVIIKPDALLEISKNG